MTCEHTYGEWEKSSETQHKRVCGKCGNEEYADHMWEEESIEVSSTLNEERYICSSCGEVLEREAIQTETTSAAESTETTQSAQPTESTEPTDTTEPGSEGGGSAVVWIVVAVVVVLAGIIIAVCVYQKKKK